jgi:quercetin dioxygenase-like cupin family protein
MNIESLHNQDKEVSAQSLFKGETGIATAIQLQKNGFLKEHISKTPALLLCIKGRVIYRDEMDKEIELASGDYVHILPNVKHWLEGLEKAQLVLVK